MYTEGYLAGEFPWRSQTVFEQLSLGALEEKVLSGVREIISLATSRFHFDWRKFGYSESLVWSKLQYCQEPASNWRRFPGSPCMNRVSSAGATTNFNHACSSSPSTFSFSVHE